MKIDILKTNADCDNVFANTLVNNIINSEIFNHDEIRRVFGSYDGSTIVTGNNKSILTFGSNISDNDIIFSYSRYLMKNGMPGVVLCMDSDACFIAACVKEYLSSQNDYKNSSFIVVSLVFDEQILEKSDFNKTTVADCYFTLNLALKHDLIRIFNKKPIISLSFDKKDKAVDYSNIMGLMDLHDKLQELDEKPECFLKNGYLDARLFIGDETQVSDKISIVVPCHNDERYIAQCLNSIFSSDFPKEFFEIIIVNDFSTDNTFQILTKFEKEYSDNIIIVNLNSNVGPAAARNIGIEYSSGNFLVFIDADDMITSDALRTFYRKMKLYTLDFVRANEQAFSEGTVTQKDISDEYFDILNNDTRKYFLQRLGLMNACWNSMYDKNFIVQNDIRFLDAKVGEDMSFTQQVKFLANRAMTISDTLYGYRQQELSLMHKQYNDIYEICLDIEERTFDLINKKCDTSGLQAEMAIIFYAETFAVPFLGYGEQIGLETNLKEIVRRYPDILSNEYLLIEPHNVSEQFKYYLQKYSLKMFA